MFQILLTLISLLNIICVNSSFNETLFYSDIALSQSKKEITTLLLVRHAEKVIGVPNPPLTAMGTNRALDLKEMLAELNLTAIYSSDFLRTRKTAEPTAKAHGLRINIYDPHRQELLLSKIRAQHAGGHILIIGHSNTIPALLNLIRGRPEYEQFSDDDYDDIYIVSLYDKRKSSIVHLNYGQPTD